MSKIKIAVATHKSYQMPKEDIYFPIQSGAVLNSTDLGYKKDNVGEHISNKNLNYSELTAVYWLWKNTVAEYKGLTHYRRHFSKNESVSLFSTGKFEDVLDKEKLEALLTEADIVLPKKRKYYIETIESHYNHTHYEEDLKVTRIVMEKLFPEYISSYDLVLSKRSAHMFNMFIMKDSLFNDYCEWLFTILFEVEEMLDISEYTPFHQRVFGRISEILLDVWIIKNNHKYVEAPVMFMEKQDWTNKIQKFIKSKLFKSKY